MPDSESPKTPEVAPSANPAPSAAASKVSWGRVGAYGVAALVVALCLLAAGLYVWKLVAVRRVEQAMQAQQTELTQARRVAIGLQAAEMLRLATLPLGWAVRGEMLKDNLNQVDDYFRLFIRERGVESLLLVDKDGKVVVASDQKLVGRSAADLVSSALLATAEPAQEQTGKRVRQVVPIMAFDARIGTLVMDYTPSE